MIKSYLLSTLFAAAVSSATTYAQDKLYSNEFPLGDVKLLESPLQKARDLNIKVLLQYSCDRLLAPYRKEAGLPAIENAPSYPNWDGLDGHVGGHYLSAMAMNAATGNEECRKRMEYMIDVLYQCWEANTKNNSDWGKDYVGGFPGSKDLWSTFKKGEFRRYFSAWAPFYNLHKMYAGLRDAWLYCDNKKAKELFLKFCDWAVFITENLSDEQMEQMLGNEHGGMNEVLADAYAITKEQKYIDCARRFSHKVLLNPLEEHVDKLDNMHANTQIPKVIGYERIAELTNDQKYHDASLFFWNTVTGTRTLAFGGNSRREHFPSKEACIDYVNDIDGPESCNTNNMLKLTEDLFRSSSEAKFADFYELATFNHILSTQHPEHGGYVYFTSARPRHYRNYSVPNEAMWCCVGTGMENHGKYGQFIYTKGTALNSKNKSIDALYVNLYTASELNWKEKGLTIRQETAFPYSESSKLVITKGKGNFKLMLRFPGWVSDGQFAVKINGEKFNFSAKPSSYVEIERKWKAGDEVQIDFPMHNYIVHMPNVPQYVALMHGPILLGMKTGTEDLRALLADDSRFGQYASGKKLPIDKAPYLVAKNVEDIANDIRPIQGKPLHFTLATQMGNPIDGELQPFFEIHDSRYMMYWLALNETSYKEYLAGIEKEEKEREALESRTVDKVQPGEQQPETDHKMETDGSNTGNTNDIFFRDARNGRSFSYLLQTANESSLCLQLKYWGQDEWKSSEFDILIDGQLFKSINNTHKWRTSQFKVEEYPIPSEFVQGKSQIRIQFKSHQGKQVGELYEVRLVKQ